MFKVSFESLNSFLFRFYALDRKEGRNYFHADYGLKAQLWHNGHSFIPFSVIEYYKNGGKSLTDATDF